VMTVESLAAGAVLAIHVRRRSCMCNILSNV
jgi:hypothetical protein